MNSLSKRLQQLERREHRPEPDPIMTMPLPELIAHVENVLFLPAGSLPHDDIGLQESGYTSYAAAAADALGLTLAQFKRYLEGRSFDAT